MHYIETCAGRNQTSAVLPLQVKTFKIRVLHDITSHKTIVMGGSQKKLSLIVSKVGIQGVSNYSKLLNKF